jgi:hypothetical protein
MVVTPEQVEGGDSHVPVEERYYRYCYNYITMLYVMFDDANADARTVCDVSVACIATLNALYDNT